MNTLPRRIRLMSAALGLVLTGIAPVPAGTPAPEKKGSEMSLTITSPSFANHRDIPPQYTCDGRGISPPLAWGGIPAGARSLVLIVDDPDAPDPAAPKRIWVHWMLYNIPADASGLGEGIAPHALPAGTLQGTNDSRDTGYGEPCPPIGKHRYFFRLYALDTILPDLKHPARAALEKAMEGHVLAHAELVGLYQRRR